MSGWAIAAQIIATALSTALDWEGKRKAASEAEDMPQWLSAFWDDFLYSWYGLGPWKGHDMRAAIYEDIEYQKQAYGRFTGETQKYTDEYRGELEDLKNTYTNRPYTFNFRILGQNVKNIPKRSLMTISTLSDLAKERYGAGMAQAGLKAKGDLYFTPNRGQQEYMKQMQEILKSLFGYWNQQKKDKPNVWDSTKKATNFWDLFGNMFGSMGGGGSGGGGFGGFGGSGGAGTGAGGSAGF